MRIISQDGLYDIPYGLTSIQLVSKTTIVAQGSYFGSGNDNFATIAEYSTEAKAQKAMEMLREYKETKEIRSIPLTKSLMESFSNVKMENFEIYTDGTGDYLKVDIVKKVEYFQFPQDEDVEV